MSESGIDSLTGRELQVAKLLAKGLSRAEVGKKLNISASTVRNHTANIRQKMKVTTGDIRWTLRDAFAMCPPAEDILPRLSRIEQMLELILESPLIIVEGIEKRAEVDSG